jgi:hypothetical protein
MDLLAGTAREILDELDLSGGAWRNRLSSRGPVPGVNQHEQVQRVKLNDGRVFYVEEARPGASVSVVFASPAGKSKQK